MYLIISPPCSEKVSRYKLIRWITFLGTILSLVSQTEQLIAELKKSAQALEAKIHYASLAQLKANWLIQQGAPEQAYKLLNDLLQKNKVPLAKSRRLSTLYSLATITFQLEKYAETIEFSQKTLSENSAQSQKSTDSTKIILARALIEQGDFEEAGYLVSEIEKNIQKGDFYHKLQFDNIKIGMFYKSRNIDAFIKQQKI